MFNIKKTVDSTTMRVALSGRLDTAAAPAAERELKGALDGIKILIIDMKDVDYVSSAGLRVFLMLQKTMNKQGQMKLINVDETVEEIFDITGFSDILTIE